MAFTESVLSSLNAGQISNFALARIDLTKLRVACQLQSNFLPRVLGPCELRPGTQMIEEVPGDALGWLAEFVYDSNLAALVVTTAGMQPLVSDAWITRPSVGSAITNGTFATDLSSWTQSDQAGATSAWATGSYMSLVGTGVNYAYRDQQVTVAGGDIGKEHGIRLVVAHGNVTILIGTSQGDGTYWTVVLKTGTYSFSFVPAGNFWIRLGANDAFQALVKSIAVEAAGAVSIPVPWAQPDFGKIRYGQSGNVIFLACDGYQQQEIIRFVTSASDAGMRSWGVAGYLCDDGPFMQANSGPITISPSSVNGSATLTAVGGNVFQTGHLGALFKLTQMGQEAVANLAGANQFTGAVRVSGLSNKNPGDPTNSSRVLAISIAGTWSATVTLQQSFGAVGNWNDVANYTSNQSIIYDDGLDNQIVYYRLGIKPGNYVSGIAVTILSYTESVQTGICRINAVASGTSATADVITQFGAAGVATSDWSEGEWSTYRGFPAAIELHEGRLFWAGPSIDIDGSISDAFDSFDPTVTGDSAPLDFTLASKPRWLLSLQRLIVGTWQPIISIRASALDEPLTPTAFVQRPCSNRGAALIRPLKIDQQGVFIGRDSRIYELDWSATANPYIDYSTNELTRLWQEAVAAGVVDAAFRRNPDTNMFFPMGDGSVLAITYSKEDEVNALTPLVMTNGLVERVAILPDTGEDDVYFIVNRTIGGVTKRFVEKLAKRTDCQGGTLSKNIDCHTVYSGSPTNTITGLAYLNGQQVVVWADGGALIVDQTAMLTVSGGSITLPGGYLASNAVIGLPYTAQLQTAKLAYGAEHGSALEQQKRVARVGIVMANVAPYGVRVGRDFTHLGGLPKTYRGKALANNQVLAAFDAVPSCFSGSQWDADARVCIQVQSPYPCAILGLVLDMVTNEPDDVPPPDQQQQR